MLVASACSYEAPPQSGWIFPTVGAGRSRRADLSRSKVDRHRRARDIKRRSTRVDVCSDAFSDPGATPGASTNNMSGASFIQVGFNPKDGVVILRAPDNKSAGGFVVQRMLPAAARTLATWLGDGVANKMLRISDGKRWTEHEVSSAMAQKIATDLQNCAGAAEGSS